VDGLRALRRLVDAHRGPRMTTLRAYIGRPAGGDLEYLLLMDGWLWLKP
jgi:hypothetical protein